VVSGDGQVSNEKRRDEGSWGSGLCARLHPSVTQRSGWRATVIGELLGMDGRIHSLQNRTSGGHQRELRTKREKIWGKIGAQGN
jgi:hypothetical protein